MAAEQIICINRLGNLKRNTITTELAVVSFLAEYTANQTISQHYYMCLAVVTITNKLE